MLMNDGHNDQHMNNTPGGGAFAEALRQWLPDGDAEISLSEHDQESGVLHYRNLYCQYQQVDSEKHHSVVLSIGWHGQGFALTVTPDMEFVLENGEWREKSDAQLHFYSTAELVDFCLRCLRKQSVTTVPSIRFSNCMRA